MRKVLPVVVVASLAIFVITLPMISCGSTSHEITQNGATCAGKQLSFDLLAQVAADLFGKDFAALESLAAKEGTAFVNCVVQETVAAHKVGAVGAGSGSAVKATYDRVIANGNEWLASHGDAK